jgi:hypothetical protein
MSTSFTRDWISIVDKYFEPSAAVITGPDITGQTVY